MKPKIETKIQGMEVLSNNILETFKRHTILAMTLVIFTSIITLWVISNNKKYYAQACQSTFIYYQNGSSVLVSSNDVFIEK